MPAEAIMLIWNVLQQLTLYHRNLIEDFMGGVESG